METTKTITQWIVLPDGKAIAVVTNTTTVDHTNTSTQQTTNIKVTSNSQGSSVTGSVSASID